MKIFVMLLAVAALVLAACSKPSSMTPLRNLPETYSLEDAKADGCVVHENGGVISGHAVWNDFVKSTSIEKAADVRLAFYYTLSDPSHYAPELYEEIKADYPKLYIKDLSYDGDTYSISGYEDGKLVSKEYLYLVKYEGKPNSATAIFSKYTYYVLVNDDSVNWDDIEHGLFSSQFGDYIDHYRVYSDLVMK